MSLTGSSGISASSIESNPKQQYTINSQQVLYQKEFNRMRERLFRILSKVPIQVETNGSSHFENEEEGTKGVSSQRCRVSDRDPVTIKYYNQRSLAEILELHFSCSLIKHNFSHTTDREHIVCGYPEASTQLLAASTGWQVEQNSPGYTSYPDNSSQSTARGVEPTHLVNQYPATRVYHQTSAGVSAKQQWNSNVEQPAKTGSYKAGEDGCSLELVDGQRLVSPPAPSRQVGTSSRLAQENEFAKVCSPIAQVPSQDYYLPNPCHHHHPQPADCLTLAPEVVCHNTLEPLAHNALNSFSQEAHHRTYLQVSDCQQAEASASSIHQFNTKPLHHEPPIYYQTSNYRTSGLVQQQQHHQHQHWPKSTTSALDYPHPQQVMLEPPKLTMIENGLQLKPTDSLQIHTDYQQLTGYTAMPSCCTFIYGASDRSQAQVAGSQPTSQLTNWAVQN